MPEMDIGDISLYYEVSGEGEPLLFIHGLGSSTRDWEFQVPEFAKSYRVVTLDLRGHGQSGKPAGPYSLRLFAEDTARLLQSLGIESAHVVGLSLGGGVAFQLAIDYPDLVKTLTIVNSGPFMTGSIETDRQVADERVNIVRQHGMRAMGQVLSGRLFPNPEHEPQRNTFVERWAENDPDAYINSTLAMVGWNVSDQISAIECPTLVLSADQDYTPIPVKEAYTKLMPNAELVVVPDARHAMPIERPEAFNAALLEFLSKRG